MSTKVTGEYLGNKKVELTHQQSGSKIKTAAPLDNNGDGSDFSPTDLVGAALGSCMLTIISILAENKGFSIPWMKFEVEKHMVLNPRRISALPITIRLPEALAEEVRARIEQAAMACPVKASLREDLEVAVNFVYE